MIKFVRQLFDAMAQKRSEEGKYKMEENKDKFVRIGACQTPEVIGDPQAALACILQFATEGNKKNVDLLLFPECFLTGYILDKAYVSNYSYDLKSEQFSAILNQLEHVKPVLVLGVSEKKQGKLYNSAVVVNRGEISGVYRKTHLIDPNELFFTPGDEYPVFEVKGLRYGINICYDAQFVDAAKSIAEQGARLLLSLSQNMLKLRTAEFWKDRHSDICIERVKETGLWYVRSDVTGVRPAGRYGEERIGYGPTFIMNPQAEIVAEVPLMTVGMAVSDIPID